MENQIKHFRIKYKLSQSQLAELLGVSLRTVQFWEAEKRNPRPIVLKLLEKLKEELVNPPQKENT